MSESLEPMAAFFDARVDGYDQHMLQNVVGCERGYPELAARFPEGIRTLLDLGCGTGLELDAIYARFPALAVTGYDLSAGMLAECARKHAAHRPTLRRESYLTADFGREQYDAATSFESLHHFTEDEKRGLYRRVWDALKPGGWLIYGDYFVETDGEEAQMRAEFDRLRAAQNVAGLVHFDTPFAIDHECAVLSAVGFVSVARVWNEGNTSILTAQKP